MPSVTEFLHAVAEPGGCILVSTKGGVQQGEKAAPNRNTHFTDVDSLLAAASIAESDGANIYFTPACFDTRVRRADKAKGAKAIWLDVDVRDDKGCATHEEALANMAQLVQTFALPAPTIVSTGGGFHLYWRCADMLTPAVWKQRAAALHKMIVAVNNKLVSDTARVTDIASLMRLPGFTNRTRAQPVVVVNIAPPTPTDEFAAIFSDARVAAYMPVTAAAQPAVAPTAAFDFSAAPSHAAPVRVPATTPTALPMAAPFSFESAPAHAQPTVATTVTTTPVQAAPRHVANPVPFTGDKPKFAQVLTRCGVIRHAHENPNQVSEPLWKMAINVIVQTEEGMDAVHQFSSGYAGYNRDETDMKAANALQFGLPVTCRTLGGLAGASSFMCDACSADTRRHTPLKGANNIVLSRTNGSPLEVAQATIAARQAAAAPPVVTAQPEKTKSKLAQRWGLVALNPRTGEPDATIELPPPPEKYMFGHLALGEAGVLTAGTNVSLTRDLIWVDRRVSFVDSYGADKVGYRVNVMAANGNENSYCLLGANTTTRKLDDWMAQRGLNVGAGPELLDYVKAACMQAHFDKHTPPVYAVQGYGRFSVNGGDVFITPCAAVRRGVTMPDDVAVDIDGRGSLAAAQDASGSSIEAWNAAFTHLHGGQHHAEFMMLASFGAALMHIAGDSSGEGVKAMILSVTGVSGSGKSWLCAMAQSLWEKPNLIPGNSTFNSIPQHAALSRHLPVFVDDLSIGASNDARDELRRMFLHFTLGQEKTRLSSSAALTLGKTWSTLLFISTNMGIMDALRSVDVMGGAAARVLEIEMPVDVEFDQYTSDNIEARRAINSNFGVYGVEFARRLMDTTDDEIRRRVQKKERVIEHSLALAGFANDRNHRRMRTKVVAIALVAGEIMQDLLPFELRGVESWAVSSLAAGTFAVGSQVEAGAPQVSRALGAVANILFQNNFNQHHIMVQAPPTGQACVVVEDYTQSPISPEFRQPLDVWALRYNNNLRRTQKRIGAPPATIAEYDFNNTLIGYYINRDFMDKYATDAAITTSQLVSSLGEVTEGGSPREVRIDVSVLFTKTGGRGAGTTLRYIFVSAEEAAVAQADDFERQKFITARRKGVAAYAQQETNKDVG